MDTTRVIAGIVAVVLVIAILWATGAIGKNNRPPSFH